MAEDLETRNLPPSSLSIEYRSQMHQIPLVYNKSDLKSFLQKNVIPAYKRIKTLNPNADLAITEYVYSKDESLEGQEKSTGKMLEDLGMNSDEVVNLASISRRKGFNPTLADRIGWRKENPDTKVDDQFLPFAARTYVIGPMVVNENIFKGSGPTFEEDVEASTFFPGNAVAIDGETLLQESNEKQSSQITNQAVVRMIEPLLKK